jgi:hypothetical protein
MSEKVELGGGPTQDERIESGKEKKEGGWGGGLSFETILLERAES